MIWDTKVANKCTSMKENGHILICLTIRSVNGIRDFHDPDLHRLSLYQYICPNQSNPWFLLKADGWNK